MAEEAKEKLLETEEVRQRIEKLKASVAEMAAYIGIDERRSRLAYRVARAGSGRDSSDGGLRHGEVRRVRS